MLLSATRTLSVQRSMLPDGSVKPPKTAAGVRVVPIVLPLRRLLVSWRLRSPHTRPDDLIVGTADGAPVQERNVRRALADAKQAAGLTETRGGCRCTRFATPTARACNGGTLPDDARTNHGALRSWLHLEGVRPRRAGRRDGRRRRARHRDCGGVRCLVSLLVSLGCRLLALWVAPATRECTDSCVLAARVAPRRSERAPSQAEDRGFEPRRPLGEPCYGRVTRSRPFMPRALWSATLHQYLKRPCRSLNVLAVRAPGRVSPTV